MGTQFRRSAKSTSVAHWQLETEKEPGEGGVLSIWDKINQHCPVHYITRGNH